MPQSQPRSLYTVLDDVLPEKLALDGCLMTLRRQIQS